MPNSSDPCQIISPLVLVGLGLGVVEGLELGVGLGLGSHNLSIYLSICLVCLSVINASGKINQFKVIEIIKSTLFAVGAKLLYSQTQIYSDTFNIYHIITVYSL